MKNLNSKVQIAIDGYAGCGKSTTAKRVAQKTGFIFIDSGAMYRAVTLYFLNHQIALDDHAAIQAALKGIHLEFRREQGEQTLFMNEEDVSREIRSMAVNQHVSQVAALAAVRHFLVAQQQSLGESQDIVMDGRDIGTVVFPSADLKVFMTAEVSERAKRRKRELDDKGENVPIAELEANIRERDRLDTSRAISPLRQAADAVVIDTTNLTIDQQTDQILSLIAERTHWQP